MRVNNDHLDGQIRLILNVESGSESDDLDVVFQFDVASYLMRDLVEPRAKMQDVFPSSIDRDASDSVPGRTFQLDA
jgi:hypothetical protein